MNWYHRAFINHRVTGKGWYPEAPPLMLWNSKMPLQTTPPYGGKAYPNHRKSQSAKPPKMINMKPPETNWWKSREWAWPWVIPCWSLKTIITILLARPCHTSQREVNWPPSLSSWVRVRVWVKLISGNGNWDKNRAKSQISSETKLSKL